jgi:hypothetical protein
MACRPVCFLNDVATKSEIKNESEVGNKQGVVATKIPVPANFRKRQEFIVGAALTLGEGASPIFAGTRKKSIMHEFSTKRTTRNGLVGISVKAHQ